MEADGYEMRGELHHWKLLASTSDWPLGHSGWCGPPSSLGFGGLSELVDRAFEIGGRFEAPIDGREPDVGDGVEGPETFEDGDAEPIARDFGATGSGFFFDVGGEGFHGGGVDGTAGDCPFDAARQLGPLEGFALAGAFDDDEGELDDPLLGREAPSARQALSAASHHATVVGGT
jgi:hypothetical protein